MTLQSSLGYSPYYLLYERQPIFQAQIQHRITKSPNSSSTAANCFKKSCHWRCAIWPLHNNAIGTNTFGSTAKDGTAPRRHSMSDNSYGSNVKQKEPLTLQHTLRSFVSQKYDLQVWSFYKDGTVAALQKNRKMCLLAPFPFWTRTSTIGYSTTPPVHFAENAVDDMARHK